MTAIYLLAMGTAHPVSYDVTYTEGILTGKMYSQAV